MLRPVSLFRATTKIVLTYLFIMSYWVFCMDFKVGFGHFVLINNLFQLLINRLSSLFAENFFGIFALKWIPDNSLRAYFRVDDVCATRTDLAFEHPRKNSFLKIPIFESFPFAFLVDFKEMAT